MNRHKLPRLIAFLSPPLLLLAAMVSLASPVGAQDKPVADTPPSPALDQVQPPAPEVANQTPDTQQAAEQIPPATGTATKTLKEFKPSEKIGADSAVSFPVDI